MNLIKLLFLAISILNGNKSFVDSKDGYEIDYRYITDQKYANCVDQCWNNGFIFEEIRPDKDTGGFFGTDLTKLMNRCQRVCSKK